MNRNAARHLALVASILLCFFVYMGYRYWGRSEAGRDNAGAASPDVFAPTDGSLPGAPSDRRPENSSPAGSLSLAPPPEGGGTSAPSDISYPIGSIDEQLSLAPPSTRPVRPSGSMEESGEGDITGLVPSMPASPPGGGAAAASPGSGSPERGSGVALPVPPGGALTPPPSSGSAESPPSLPLPPTAGGQPPAAAPVSRPGSASLAPPPAAPLRPSATPGTTETRAVLASPTPPPPTNSGPPSSSTRPPAASTPAPSATRPSAPAGPGPTPNLPENTQGSDSLRTYIVQPGDTLSRIAARELGSIALADNIFLLNRDVISDPDHLMAGVHIRLPIRETLPGVAGRGDSERSVIHRVRRGETLSSIAAQYYGSASAWQFLHQANLLVLPDPNQLSVGMELVIPPYEEAR